MSEALVNEWEFLSQNVQDFILDMAEVSHHIDEFDKGFIARVVNPAKNSGFVFQQGDGSIIPTTKYSLLKKYLEGTKLKGSVSVDAEELSRLKARDLELATLESFNIETWGMYNEAKRELERKRRRDSVLEDLVEKIAITICEDVSVKKHNLSIEAKSAVMDMILNSKLIKED